MLTGVDCWIASVRVLRLTQRLIVMKRSIVMPAVLRFRLDAQRTRSMFLLLLERNAAKRTLLP